MTAQNDCPKFAWCTGYGPGTDNHEHYGPVGATSATLTSGVNNELGPDYGDAGIEYPTIRAGVSYSETEDPMPFVWLHIQGGGRDEDVGLNVLEAIKLVDLLGKSVERVRSSVQFGTSEKEVV
ncbi:hypothetical protein CH298_13175 [Rhodococcoides fascians]|uniref:hypothetical protein n=1 Tax=Rhodococcoides fascians TaxID=1828 RepID=UPI000B9AD627|nr:hypothetical protein [Rhodococcus fascians]OZE89932.1 hypothetical protein CH303_13055 [Rhodococcus fascians]OZF18239.1 hypothetical protein CH298_13175 [Rhodococcus fascians]OZF21690.1 hypothetical protein CH297_13070 [Rhodococcus fascians]OZF67315.1 hypothetical protein CH308_12970 [Rhodococcus fascians]